MTRRQGRSDSLSCSGTLLIENFGIPSTTGGNPGLMLLDYRIRAAFAPHSRRIRAVKAPNIFRRTPHAETIYFASTMSSVTRMAENCATILALKGRITPNCGNAKNGRGDFVCHPPARPLVWRLHDPSPFVAGFGRMPPSKAIFKSRESLARFHLGFFRCLISRPVDGDLVGFLLPTCPTAFDCLCDEAAGRGTETAVTHVCEETSTRRRLVD